MGQTGRAELARLSAQLRALKPSAKTKRMQDRGCELLAAGVEPCVPTTTNSIGMVLALIPPGTFLMGSPEGEKERRADEHQHEVEITQAFYLGVFPVTQAEYLKVA